MAKAIESWEITVPKVRMLQSPKEYYRLEDHEIKFQNKSLE